MLYTRSTEDKVREIASRVVGVLMHPSPAKQILAIGTWREWESQISAEIHVPVDCPTLVTLTGLSEHFLCLNHLFKKSNLLQCFYCI